MGLWEDAARRSSEIKQQDVNRGSTVERRRAEVAAQRDAVREFVDAMHRLGIEPQKHKWYSKIRAKHALFMGKRGWSVSNPRHEALAGGLVVTPDRRVYSMDLFWEKQPLDLSLVQSFQGYASPETTLVEKLTAGLAQAMRG